MTHNLSDWFWNLGLRLAAAVFLVTLMAGLLSGMAPLTILPRSAAAFAAFAMLGWALSLVAHLPEATKEEGQEADSAPDTALAPAAS